MSAHLFCNEWSNAEFLIPDPGTGKAIVNSATGIVGIITGASGETNTLANPSKEGIELILAMRTDGGGDRVITVASAYNDAGSTTITLSAVGQSVALRSIPYGSGFRWRTVGATAAGNSSIADAGSFTAQTTVEAALAEIYQHMFSTVGGCVQIPLSSFRLIASNDIAAKNAADGGTISVDTDPKYYRNNGATDKGLRIAWESGSVIEITAPFVYPPDLDDTADVVVNLFAGMKAASVDVPVMTVSFWEGVGDTNAGGNSAALSTTAAQKTVTILAADIGAYPKAATIALFPGAHATASNDVYLYGVWITYKKKLLTA